MCGIAGMFNLDGRPVDQACVKRMISVQKHRGPDDDGSYFDRNIGLGHCRLSIIDLSNNAHQPMCNGDGTKWIVFNGEIYNYLEIRAELTSLGHAFRSKSDTEVLIHAIEQWGEDALLKLNGMWAFALWDKTKRTLLCARDRFGIKPFYYLLEKDRFIFASEIKGILSVSDKYRSPDNRSIYSYLAKGYGYIDVDENTFFKDIKQLKQGCFMKISSDKCLHKKYWQLNINPDSRLKNVNDVVEKFGYLFKDAVKLAMRSDVPVGVSLSGGLDSTSIAMLMPEFTQNKIKSFSAHFQEESFNEKAFIDAIVEKNVFEAHFISPDPAVLIKEFEKIIWHQDEPYTGASVFSQWEIMKKTREENIKVLLTGQGGDEILAGYYKLLPYYFADLLKDMKFCSFMGNIINFDYGKGYSRASVLSDSFRILASNIVPAKVKKVLKNSIKGSPEYLDKDFLSNLGDYSGAATPGRTKHLIDRELYDSVYVSPLPALLHSDDRNSMANSVESRPPLLDHRLAEFASSLPYDMKIRNGFTKFILREAMKGKLPDSVRLRRDKMGFVTPARIWFRREMKDYIYGIFDSQEFRKRGIFCADKVKIVLDSHFEGGKDHSFTIWSWLNLELWFRVFIDRRESVK